MPFSRPVLVTVLISILLAVRFVEASTFEGVDEEWRLLADTIRADRALGILEAEGNVVLFHGDDFLQADYARYYMGTRWVYLQGHVKAKWEGDYLEARTAEFDLENRLGWLKDGEVFMADPHMYFKGHQIRKTGQSTYSFVRATVTACDGASPAWSLECSSGNVTIDGYARIHEPKFRIKDRPVLYSPYLVVPVKTKRQSGFLLPEIGQSSRLGFQFNQPYYQVLDEETDLTAYANLMTRRGLMTGLEYRHTPDLRSKGLWKIDYLYDHVVAKTRGELDSQFQNDAPLLLRPHHNRYWLRNKYDGYLSDPRWKIKFDTDFVSDALYLREFKNGITGFNESRRTFLDQFGRDIADDDALERTSQFILSRNWSGFGLDARVKYTQNLRYFNDASELYPAEDNPTVQSLPEINFNTYKTALMDGPLEWQSQSQLVYFWREFGTTGTRLETSPSLSLPLSSDFGALIGTVGWRGTGYAVDRHQADPDNAELDPDRSFYSRSLPFAQAVASTSLFKVYDLGLSPEDPGQGRWTRMKHQLLPKLTYDLIPNETMDQRENPYFDEHDRIKPASNLTYSLTNTFTRRMDTRVGDASAEGNATTLAADYLDFLWIKIEQSFDFREADRTEETERYERRPFSDIMAQISCTPKRYLNLQSRTYFSPYLHRLTSHEHELRAFLPKGLGNVFCGLDFRDMADDEYPDKTNYRNPDTENGELGDLRQRILALGAVLDLSPAWRISTLYRADMEDGVDLEKRIDLLYRHQCYSWQLTAQETDYDTRFSIQVNLLNLGSVGN
ncbi:MAG: LPS-assembly protein LptD [Deltaproteobacteria bacterium]|nr:LPS-assembly protein LptD [Deltaproteobacteria bacterium]